MKKIVAVLLAIVCMMSLFGCSKKAETVRIGTAGTGGVYDEIGKALKSVLSENGVESELKNTSGSAANLRLLSEDYLDFAIAQADIANDAYNADGTFKGKKAYKGYSAVAELYTEAVQIVVPAKSKIKTIDDLQGKKVNIGEEESGSERNAIQVLAAYGITENMIKKSNLNYADAVKQLTDGTIDAFFCTVGANTKIISEMSGIRLLSIDKDRVGKLTSAYNFYSEYVIPAGTYEGVDEDITTVGVKSMLFASNKVSDSTVESVTKALFENIDKIQEGVSTKLEVTAPDEPDSFAIATHTGATSYYDEESKPKSICKFSFQLDMYQTIAVAVVVLLLGELLRKKISFLRKFCIPAPVVGGLLFAILTLILYSTKLVEISFNDTLKEVCMVMFFTSVGFQANLKVLKSGGKSLIVFLLLVVVLIVGQNFLALGLSKALNIDALIGLCTGSIPMVGGHGTAGAFGPVLEDFGAAGATTVCTAAATFGLVVGSLIGGPIGNRLISKRNLKPEEEEDDSVLVQDEEKHKRNFTNYAPAVFQIIIAMGLGTIVSYLLSLTGMTFPIYIGSMIVAAIMRNIGEYTGKINIHMGEINDLGGISLSLFLGIAMITLKLWQLADLALPLVVLLTGQTIFMILFTYFVVFRVMGRNYDAAVLSAGTCGFGMGATPNAMANMQALCDKYYPSVKAYILIPIVGSLFADFINSLTVTFFINMV